MTGRPPTASHQRLHVPAAALLAIAASTLRSPEWLFEELAHAPGLPQGARGDARAVFVHEVGQITALLDTEPDRRMAALAYAHLLELAGGNLEKVRAALQVGNPPPRELFALGEISSGERFAAAALGGSPVVRDSSTNPFDAAPRVHISMPRLELYVHGDRATLGPRVFARINDHVHGCTACADAADVLRLPRTG